MPNITTLNHAITHTYYYYHIIMKDAKTAAAAVFLTLMGLNVQAQVSHVQPGPWQAEFLYFLLSSTLLRCVELWMNSLTKTGYSRTFPPVINPLSFFTHLVPHFLEVWKCGIVWQIQDIVALFSCHELIIILYNVLCSTLLLKHGSVE